MTVATIDTYHAQYSPGDQAIFARLRGGIEAGLPAAQGKIWHAHPVWFLAENPIVGYNRLKAGVRLMFWSGADFGEPTLKPGTGKFKDAAILYTDAAQIDADDLRRWLDKAGRIQWDYKNLIRNRKLVRID